MSLGAGKRLFVDGAPASGYDLVDSRITGTGVVYSVLRPVPFVSAGHEVVDGKDTISS